MMASAPISFEQIQANVDAACQQALREFHGTLLRRLTSVRHPLDHKEPDTLSLVTYGMLIGGFQTEALSEIIGLRSRTTPGRWALRQHRPRSPGERMAYTHCMLRHLEASANGEVDLSGMALPSPRRVAKLRRAWSNLEA